MWNFHKTHSLQYLRYLSNGELFFTLVGSADPGVRFNLVSRRHRVCAEKKGPWCSARSQWRISLTAGGKITLYRGYGAADFPGNRIRTGAALLSV